MSIFKEDFQEDFILSMIERAIRDTLVIKNPQSIGIVNQKIKRSLIADLAMRQAKKEVATTKAKTFDFSQEEAPHPHLPPMSEEERLRERMRNILSPIVGYFSLLNEIQDSQDEKLQKLLIECKAQAEDSIGRLKTILREDGEWEKIKKD